MSLTSNVLLQFLFPLLLFLELHTNELDFSCMERHPGIQASAECDSTMQPERKEILQVGHYYIKK